MALRNRPGACTGERPPPGAALPPSEPLKRLHVQDEDDCATYRDLHRRAGKGRLGSMKRAAPRDDTGPFPAGVVDDAGHFFDLFVLDANQESGVAFAEEAPG